jgi:uncharacterized membrane protein YhdT
MIPKLTDKEINTQIKKEVIISLVLYAAFFIWWYVTGYGVAAAGTPQTYTYILGLPMWFFLSCIVGYILFSIAAIVVVKKFFKDFELEEEHETEL